MKYDRVVCVGPGRSGSTFLYYQLSGMEPVALLHDKEKNALYKKNDTRWRLDFSNTYIYRSDIVDRVADIATRMPSEDIGLVFLRRNTVDRLNSLYRYQIQAGIIKMPEEFFQNIKEAPEFFFVGGSATKLFDSSRALSNVDWIFISFEDLRDSRRLEDIFGDLPTPHEPQDFQNPSLLPRHRSIMTFARVIFLIVKSLVPRRWANVIKKHPALIRLLYSGRSAEVLEFPSDLVEMIDREEALLNRLQIKSQSTS